MPMTPKQMVNYLEKHGFVKVRQTGSHLMMSGNGRTTFIPMHCRDLKKGIEHAILKQAGLERRKDE